MDKNSRTRRSRLISSLRYGRARDGETNIETSFSAKAYTFEYEVSDLKGPAVNFKPNALEFGTAFEFAPKNIFSDHELPKQKEKFVNASEDIFASDDDIPAQYQSIFSYESAFHDETRANLDGSQEFAISSRFSVLLVVLSTLLLLITFPIAALFCVKRLPKTKRIIIFRLGRQLKPRGPGCILVLPFVDEGHIIDLNEQELNVKPISATTADNGEVKIGCQVIYHIIEAESAVTYWTRDPYDLVLKRTQLALPTAVCRIHWSDLVSGHGLPDVACDIQASVNSYCSSYGMQILEVKLSEVISVREPPVTSDKALSINFQELGKQIANISPLLIGEGAQDSKQTVSAQFTEMINQLASLKVSQADNAVAIAPPKSTNDVPNQASSVKVDEVIEKALSRGQGFLNIEKARAALGRASLQVFVYASNVQQENNPMTAFYLDSDTGKSGRGIIDCKKPSATIHINAANLAETLDGRFDLMEALTKSQIRFTGSLLALSKLRFLLQFI